MADVKPCMASTPGKYTEITGTFEQRTQKLTQRKYNTENGGSEMLKPWVERA